MGLPPTATATATATATSTATGAVATIAIGVVIIAGVVVVGDRIGGWFDGRIRRLPPTKAKPRQGQR